MSVSFEKEDKENRIKEAFAFVDTEPRWEIEQVEEV